ncbi:MAG: glycosyltransferase family 2 protein [Saprospiraceae bacterium]|nr:glycosyltransferase family 2 protein [Saprospiraceae bacterium]
MVRKADIYIIIPAYNEENSIELVINDIPKDIIKEIIVVDNNSDDNTSIIAKNAGAIVLGEKNQGYGLACLKGIEYLKNIAEESDIIVFIDADYSDFPEQIPQLVAPILLGNAELVIGSRNLGTKEKGSMTFQQIFGNWLATKLIKWLYGAVFTDLGPFRAIKYGALIGLEMCDKTYGWTVEMQIKAVKNKLKYIEIPVDYRNRIGKSKISGTLKGTLLAGYKIITTIFKYK